MKTQIADDAVWQDRAGAGGPEVDTPASNPVVAGSKPIPFWQEPAALLRLVTYQAKKINDRRQNEP